MHALASVLGYVCIACPVDFFNGLKLLDSEEGLRFVELVKGVHSCVATTRVKVSNFDVVCVWRHGRNS
jgi:hypothetical protein